MSLKGVPDSAPSAANPACKHIGNKFVRKSCSKKIISMIIEMFKESNTAHFYFTSRLGRKNSQAVSRVSIRWWSCLWSEQFWSKQPQCKIRQDCSSIFPTKKVLLRVINNLNLEFLHSSSSIQLLTALICVQNLYSHYVWNSFVINSLQENNRKNIRKS